VPAEITYPREHTLKHMRSELSTTNLINRRMRDNWIKAGSMDMPQVANEQARQILENYQAAPLPEDVRKKIRAIVEEGEEEARELEKFNNATL
jgi:trimethylamine---corrinoid protein Co-methyltransferase